MISKDELVQLTHRRVAEAEALAEAGHLSGAYYLLGYAVEHAIKAILADKIQARTMPDRKFVDSFYDHDLAKLASHAGLAELAKGLSRQDPFFATNWTVVRAWTVESRYRSVPDEDYNALKRAVLDADTGVLSWIRTHW